MVPENWRLHSNDGSCPMHHLVMNLKNLKSVLKQWNFKVFGNIHANVDKARESLASIQNDMSLLGITTRKLEEEVSAKCHLLDCLHMENDFWHQKARLSWLKDGDNCTKFFHTHAKVKATRSRIAFMKILPVMWWT